MLPGPPPSLHALPSGNALRKHISEYQPGMGLQRGGLEHGTGLQRGGEQIPVDHGIMPPGVHRPIPVDHGPMPGPAPEPAPIHSFGPHQGPLFPGPQITHGDPAPLSPHGMGLIPSAIGGVGAPPAGGSPNPALLNAFRSYMGGSPIQ